MAPSCGQRVDSLAAGVGARWPRLELSFLSPSHGTTPPVVRRSRCPTYPISHSAVTTAAGISRPRRKGNTIVAWGVTRSLTVGS